MEYGTIEREIRIEASPATVFEVITSPEHLKQWMTESGFREMGWEVAVLEQQYQDHVQGWDHFLPRLVDYAATVRVSS